ncbi:hypothetical protein [Sphingomicrobium flavum]|uniref:hypothetical protein n=1 Tax=Sphingomicrobium flavum TaxID=1229164 RepID=UPI0021AD99A4|nr:hypothetical protein [Sphingomicrobium flavum]
MANPHSVEALVDEYWDSYSADQQSAILIQRAFDQRLDQILPQVVAQQGVNADVEAWLASDFGLAQREVAFLLKLIEEVDIVALEADRVSLEKSLEYVSLSEDMERAYDDLERPIYAIDDLLERPLVGTAQGMVVDAYFARQAWLPLVEAQGQQSYRFPEQFERLLSALDDAEHAALVERLWTGVTNITVQDYLVRAVDNHPSEIDRTREHLQFAIDAFAEAARWFERVGHTDAASHFREERQRLENGSMLAEARKAAQS